MKCWRTTGSPNVSTISSCHPCNLPGAADGDRLQTSTKPIHWVQQLNPKMFLKPGLPPQRIPSPQRWISQPYLVSPAPWPPTVADRSWVALGKE